MQVKIQTIERTDTFGATGFEPATSWSRTKRATNCATPRIYRPSQSHLNILARLVHRSLGEGGYQLRYAPS